MPSIIRRDDRDGARDGFAWLEAKAAAPVSNGTGYGGWGGWGIASDGLGPAAGDVPLHLNVVVAACVGWLARNFPVADLHVIKETTAGDGEEVEDHAAIELLNRPNPTDDFFSFWSAFVLSDAIDGNTFFIKVRNRLGIHSLWWAPPWDVDILPDPANDADRPIKSFRVRTAKGVAEYPPEDVVHIKDGKDPANPLRGLAPLKAGIRSASTIDRAELYTSTLMRNMGAVSYMLSPADPKETIHKDNVVQLREQFTERTSGANNGKPFVSPQGLKADRMGLSPEEMALDRIREFPTAALCALIGTHAMAVGLPDPGKTFSNLEMAERFSWNNGLIPRQARAAEAFDRQCPELIGENERLKWDYSHVKALQEDENAKIDGLIKATGKPFLTRNEARDQLHLDAIDGWDAQDEEPPPPPVIAPPPGLPGKRPQAALPAPEKGKMADPFDRGGDRFYVKLNWLVRNGLMSEDVALKHAPCRDANGRFRSCGGSGGGKKPKKKPRKPKKPGHGTAKPGAAAKPATAKPATPRAKPAASPKPAATKPASTSRPRDFGREPHESLVKWEQQAGAAQKAKLDVDELQSLAQYSHRGDEWMNARLRGRDDWFEIAKAKDPGANPEKLRARADKTFDNFKSATSKFDLPDSVVAYRGIRDFDTMGAKLKKGDIVHERGAASTSLSEAKAREFTSGGAKPALLRISAPKGAKAATMEGMGTTNFHGEHELLIAPGHGKYRITRVSRGEVPIVHAELIP